MQVTVVRRGGIAGVVRRGQLNTAQLGNPGETEELLRNLPFDSPETTPGPDRFRYEITVTDGATSRTAHLLESDLPASLRPSVDAALATGTID